MRQTFNVLFFIRKTRALKSGENPIMLRISIAGQLSEIQLKRAVKPNLWNQNKERCTGKDAASLEINRYLESVKLRLFEIHRKMEEENKLINPMEIKRKFLGLDEEHKMFFQVFQEHNDKCRELINKDYAKVTISRFDTCLKYMKEMALKQYHLKDIPLQILEKYKEHTLCQKKGVLLPVMVNQKMNSYLKEIAICCGIKKNLSTHTGRHTFSTTVALANNVSLENVAKMLGHANTKMTQRYAKVLDQSILRDMQGVRKNFAKR